MTPSERPPYQALFEIAPGCHLVVDRDLIIAAVSDDYLRLTKSNREELVGRPVFSAFPETAQLPSSNQVVDLKASFERVLHLRKVDRFIGQTADVLGIESQRGPLEAHYWELVTSPVLDSAGDVEYIVHTLREVTRTQRPQQDGEEEIARWFGTHTDVTHQQKGEEELRAAHARLDAALEAGTIGTWQWEIAEDRLRGDSGLANLFNLSADQVTSGMRLEQYIAAIHPDDRAAMMEAVGRAKVEGGRYETDFRILLGNGAVRWVVSRGRVSRNGEGKEVRVLGVVVDITDRKRSEQALLVAETRFRLMTDSIDQLIWVTRADGYHEYYNKRWYDYTGVPVGSTDGEGWNNLFHPEDQARAWALWRHSLETGEPYEIEYRLRHHTGEFRWVLGRALAFRDDTGQIRKWFGTCTDIHDQKRALQEREELLRIAKEAAAQAEAANRTKDEFLANLSHELRTPLNAILGWARILKSEKATQADIREGLEVIGRNAFAQSQLIADLLDLSRIVSGKLTLDLQQVPLVDIVALAVDAVMPTAVAKRISIEKVADSDSPVVFVDPTRLQQVVWNLLTNAVKFTSPGGTIVVAVSRSTSQVEVSVTDTGLGIAPEFLPYVFDRFRQADSTTSRRYGGLGLGLAIVKQLVESHGGTVNAESPGEGQGSTFVVTLPIAAFDEDGRYSLLPTDPSGGAKDVSQENELAGVRVLVVDDDADARVLISRILEGCGATVKSTSSAQEAVGLVKRFRPSLLISDIGMPVEDGYQLIRQLRERFSPRALPAIALTAFAGSEDKALALGAGFQLHIPKPVNPDYLVEAVASLAFGNG